MDTIMKWVRADYHAQMLRNEASNLYRPPLGEISPKCTKMLVKHKENRFWRQKNQPTSGGIGWRAGKCSDRADFWYVPNPYVNPSNARAILWFSVRRYHLEPRFFWQARKKAEKWPKSGLATEKKGFEGARRPPQKDPKKYFSKKLSLNPNISKNYRNRATELVERSKTLKIDKNQPTSAKINQLRQIAGAGQPWTPL